MLRLKSSTIDSEALRTLNLGVEMAPKIGKQQEDRATGSDAIAANEDLLTLILLFLPVKSLLRFKSVSKNWLSLITSPHFCDLKSKRFSKHVSGLLLRRIYKRAHFNPKYDFIPLDEDDDDQSAAPRIRRNSPMRRLNFVHTEGTLQVIQHCNGLLLCRDSPEVYFLQDRKYYVFNPTTKDYTSVSLNGVLDSGIVDPVLLVNLAFDPRKSPHFKLICIYYSCLPGNFYCELGIYSSETGVVRKIDGRLRQPGPDYSRGLYWNGAVNWIDYKQDGLYFNVDEERVGTLPMPPVPDGMEGTDFWEETGRWIRYYGESNDHLHLIQNTSTPTAQFDVYEMDKAYSGWFVKFRVDLEPVLSSFPEAIDHELTPLHEDYYLFGVLGVVRKDEDGKSFLVLNIPGKAIKFHFEDGSFTKLCDVATANDDVYGWRHSIQFIGSLYRL